MKIDVPFCFDTIGFYIEGELEVDARPGSKPTYNDPGSAPEYEVLSGRLTRIEGEAVNIAFEDAEAFYQTHRTRLEQGIIDWVMDNYDRESRARRGL